MKRVKHMNFYGTKVRQIPCITGENAPTSETKGAVGCLYMDTLSGSIYGCVAVTDGVYTWKPIGGGSAEDLEEIEALMVAINEGGVE